MGQIRASHYDICNHRDGITGSFVLPFPLVTPLSPSHILMRLHIRIYTGTFTMCPRRKREAYVSGGSYAVQAGKDGSLSWTISMSRLWTEDAVADCSMLKEKVCKTFDDWHTFFTRTPPLPLSVDTTGSGMILSTVVDLPLLLRATRWLIVRASRT